MLLKRLEISGFKSFADRTVLEFGPGITAIVGPNGCGKSNISDAIRWVLGEQNARQLRGTRMEDLIFNGSAGRRALGLAEVHLTLDNSTGTLPTDYREVTIGRRIDRSGASDYLINRTPCRLRDVQELLYDTGLGRDAYTLVGQGRIDEVLAARSEDRRSLLEEAAGIVRFKARRQEAVRRLGHVEQRLERLGDIVAELEARLEPLEREAARARRHRELTERLHALERELRLAELQRLTRQLRQRQRATRQAREVLEDLRRRLAEAQAQVTDLRRQAADLEHRLDGARETLGRLAAEAESVSARRQVMQERRQHLEARRDQLDGELADLSRRLGEKGDEASGDAERLAELEARHGELAALRARLEADLAAAEGRARELERALAAARDEAFEALREAANARNESTAAETELRSLDARQARIQVDLAEAEAHIAEVRAACTDLERRLQAAREELERRRRELADLADAAGRVRDELRNSERRLQDLQERLADARGRVRTLSELQRAYEGFFAGVRAALKARDAGDPEFADVIGVVAELISTRAEYEAALEAALGGAVQNLVARTAGGAQRAVEALRRRGAGRATFLPLDGLRVTPRREADLRAARLPGVIGWAVDLVDFDPEIRTAAEYLLGRVLVAQDLTSARAAARASGYALRVVTLDGDVVHPGGPITGGSRPQQRGGLLSRQRELEEAREAAEGLERQYAAARAELERLRQESEEIRDRRARAEAALRELNGRIAGLERELAATRQRLASAERQHEGLVSEGVQLEARRAELARSAQAAQERADREAQRAEAARNRAVLLERELPALQQAASALRERLAETAASADALAEQLAALRSWSERVRREREALAERLRSAEAERQEVDRQIARCAEEVEEARRREARITQQRQEAEAQVAALRAARQQVAEALAAAETAVDELRGRVEAQSERLHRAELEEDRVRGDWQRLRQALDMAEAEAGPAGDEAEGGEAADQPEPSAREIAEAAREAQRLREELDELGPVNPAAEDEYRAVRERYRFLRGQMDDLAGARRRLQDLIDQIDRHMEMLFRATFRQLREKFQQVFQRLFGGGRADLVLVAPGAEPGAEADGDDDGEPAVGVDIVAQPPGKRMQALSLLSGGERALTAIALLFAMLEVKPPPFCILDEIEAALDDANLRRFVDYLTELSRRIQFIVITHQKTTMAAADTLYGVTLAEDGASRLVAVRLAAMAGASQA